MDSQVYYILASMVFTSAALSTIFFLAWKYQGKKPHALSWSIGFGAATLHWFVMLNANLFGNRELPLLVAIGLTLVFMALLVRGHCQRTECELLPSNLWPYGTLLYAVSVYVTLVEPHAAIRMAIIPAIICVALMFSALIILRHRDKPRPGEWAAAISMILFALSQGTAAGMALLQAADGEGPYGALYMGFNFIALPAGYITTSMFVVFMLASDLSAEMKQLAVRDELTGLLNRRGFTENGERAFALARRNGAELAVIMTDIDRFKFVNDRFGHAAGDAALRHFAELLLQKRRTEDIVGRVGGEEFALLLPGTDARDAMALADQLCDKIGSTPIDLSSIGLPLTSSFGVASISKNDTDLDDMMRRADRALYRSKRAGRNQVDLESSQLMLAADGTLKPAALA